MSQSKDMESETKELVAFNSQTIATNTTTVGNEIDTAGYEAVTFFNSLGDWTDGTFTPALTESETSGGSFTAVADADLLPAGTGQEATAVLGTADNAISKIGYRGDLGFLKMTFVSAGTSSGSEGVHSICALQKPAHAPVA